MKKLTALILTLTMLFSLCAFPVAAETETDNRVWFDLDGNSKFFVKKDSNTKYIIGEEVYNATDFANFRTNFKDYLPGVDFAGFLAAPTGDFATDQPLVVNPGNGGSMFLYTTDKNTNGTQYATPDFTTGEDGYLYWTINDVAYRVNPNENVIKVSKNAIDTSAISASTMTDTQKSEMIARYESVNAEAVIDVEDGRYKNVGLLVGLNAGSNRNATVTLVYDGDTDTETITIAPSKASSETNYLMGTLYLQNFTLTTGGGSNALGGHGFIPFTFETDPSKTLTAIKIKDATTTSVKLCIYVVSAWGVEKTLAEFIAEIDAAIEEATTVAELEAIDVASIEEDFNCALTAQRTAIANKIAEIGRVAGLDNRYENVELNLFEDVFATDADFTTTGWYENKKYAVSKTAKTDNILAMKGFEASSSGKGYPNGNNSVAFRTDALNEVANLKDGVFTTTNGVPFKLGKIETKNSKVGANAFIPRAVYSAEYFTGDQTAINALPENYTADSAYQILEAEWPLNKKGISSVNLLMTTLLNNDNNKFYDIYVKYEGETATEHHYAFAGRFDNSFEGTVKLVPKATYDSIKDNGEYTANVVKISEITVDQLNALRGYTPDSSVTVDTSKLINSKNYTKDTFNAATGFNLSSVPTNWTANDELKAVFTSLNAKSKYQQIVNANPVALSSLSANLDLEKITAAYTDVNVALPKDSTKFVPARRYTTSQTDYANTYVANTIIPVNPDKTVESIKLEANMTDPATMILSSGGFCTTSNYGVVAGMLMLNYNGNSTVTIDGTEYVIYMTVQRECSDAMLLGMTLTNAKTLADEIAELNEELAAIDPETITVEEITELKEKIAEIKAKSEDVLDSDFNTEKLKLAEGKYIDTLKLKVNFPMSEENGANSKLFIDYETYQGYANNQKVTEEWVPGLDFSGIVKADTSVRPHTSYPTGTDADIISSYSNALIFKVDQAPVANPVQYNVPFVNLTTKNGTLTWNVNGTDFAINPYEKVVKVYTPTDASGVEDATLRARFATLDNPVLDIEDGCYESITVLAGANGKRTLTPTVIYKDGSSKKLSGTVTAGNSYVAGESQDTGFQYLQALTYWSNTNSGGAAKFGAITITGFDTTKVVDKISFTSDQWGYPIFVISAYGESATLSEILAAADANDFASAEYAVNTVDAILAQNGLTTEDLSSASLAKYNDLKTAGSVLSINEIALEDNVLTVNYSYDGASAKAAIILVVEYKDDEESEFVSVKKYPVSFTKDETELTTNVETTAGNKVKVLVWKNLTDFFPLTANIYSK